MQTYWHQRSKVIFLQHTTHCNTLQHAATHCNTLQHAATHCSTVCCRTYLQHYNTLQHTATHCNTLQHTATHCSAVWFAKYAILCRNLCISATDCRAVWRKETSTRNPHPIAPWFHIVPCNVNQSQLIGLFAGKRPPHGIHFRGSVCLICTMKRIPGTWFKGSLAERDPNM